MNKQGYVLVDLLLSLCILYFCVLLLTTCVSVLKANQQADPYHNALVLELYGH
ncbi:MAG: hypothetical protein ACRDBX_00205 [Erysipelotrichaceae bacterium]